MSGNPPYLTMITCEGGGDGENCASRGVMGDSERVMSRDAFFIGGGGGTLGGGDK